MCDSYLHDDFGPLAAAFPRLAALRRHGGLACPGWIDAAVGHPALRALELDLRDQYYDMHQIETGEALAEVKGWLELTAGLPALSSLTLAIDVSFFQEPQGPPDAAAGLPHALSFLQGATQLTRLDLTAELGLPLHYVLACLGQYLGGRLRSLRVAGATLPESSAAFQLFPLPGSLPELAALTLAAPPVEALVMALLQPLGALLPQCPALKTLRLESGIGKLDTGRAGLRRLRARSRALCAGGACKVYVT